MCVFASWGWNLLKQSDMLNATDGFSGHTFVLCLAMSEQQCDFQRAEQAREKTHNDLFSRAQEQLLNYLDQAL